MNNEFTNQLGEWLPKEEVMDFLQYGKTQMNEFIKKHQSILKVSRIGRRVFISLPSLLEVLELNVVGKQPGRYIHKNGNVSNRA